MKTLKLGLIGAGRIGMVHGATLTQNIPQVKLISVADIDLKRARMLAKKFKVDKVTDNYKLIMEDPDIDAVIICSPTETHADYIIQAAKAGKHIFCEKPIDLNLSAIKNALDTVEDCGVKLMVGFNRRFDPNFMKIHQMVINGKIGDPHILNITSRDPSPPPAEYTKISGGMFLDMTIHDFDMARYIVNSEVMEVYTKATILVDPSLKQFQDVDTAIVTLSFENGAIGVINNSRKAVYGYDQRVEIFGSKGMVKIDNNFPNNHQYYSSDGVHSTLPLNFFMERYLEAYSNEMKIFCNAILKNENLPANGFDGYISVAIAIAAKKSHEEKRPVKMSEII